MLEPLTDPAARVVLGIDNLVFIAILAEKLPPHQRDKVGHPFSGRDLIECNVRSLMTARTDISWVNLHGSPEVIRAQLLEAPHAIFPVCRGLCSTRWWAWRAPRTCWAT